MIPIQLIQHADRNVISKEYEHLKNGELLVTSFFRTIQGEGPLAGYPSVFLRLAGCNFGAKTPSGSCSWCDTNFQFDKATQYDAASLLQTLTNLPGYSPQDILVVTGGEPTLQHNLLAFIKLVNELSAFSKVQLETNGTQTSFFQEMSKLDYNYHPMVVVSPKANYKANRYPKISDTVLQYTDALKFVVEDDPTSPHYEVPDWALEIDMYFTPIVYVSPMARYLRSYDGEISSIWEDGLIDKVATSRNYSYAASYALKHNLKLSLQQHLFVGVA